MVCRSPARPYRLTSQLAGRRYDPARVSDIGNHPVSSSLPSLVTEGLRNEAIAQRLFIAPGTVKVHLSHIFTKLGITTRAELAAQAASRT